MTRDQVKKAITSAFKKYAAAPHHAKFNPIPKKLTDGKLYESYILGVLAEKLTNQEGLNLRLITGTEIRLRSSGGPIDLKFPHIDVYRRTNKVAEIWTDIEFLTLSYKLRGSPPVRLAGDMHELDIVMVDPGTTDFPPHDSIWLGVECKNTSFEKKLLKEVLGVRREMCFLQDLRATRFNRWPRVRVPADPPSCLLVYSADPDVANYTSPSAIFGVDFFHEAI